MSARRVSEKQFAIPPNAHFLDFERSDGDSSRWPSDTTQVIDSEGQVNFMKPIGLDETDALLGLDILSPDSNTPSSTPDVPEGSTTSYTDAMTATALRKRLAAVSLATEGNIAVIDASKAKAVPEKKPVTGNIQSYLRQPHPLVDHHDKRIAEMAMDYSDLQSELTSQGPECVTWPNNITIRDFARFHLFPTLVYELEYPRTDR